MTAQPALADVSTSFVAADRASVTAAGAHIPGLDAHPLHMQALPGGLTNRNYRIALADGRPAVARCSSGKSTLLAIDRTAEVGNARIAAGIGVGPEVIGFAPDQGVAVVEWINGRTFCSDDLDDSTQLSRVARACLHLHSGPRFLNDFDMFAVQRGYLETVVRRGFRLPPRYVDFMPVVDQIRAALDVQDEGTVACHNDLLAANIMDDGERIWFIDYEYSGNNDPCFELGNIWSEADLAPSRLEELMVAYYGRPSPAKLARARLFALMSKYGWTLWASIQDAISDVSFDFWSWGMQKYERAVAEFDSSEFSQLIEDVQQPT